MNLLSNAEEEAAKSMALDERVCCGAREENNVSESFFLIENLFADWHSCESALHKRERSDKADELLLLMAFLSPPE